jgi:hypothetical protein
MSRDGVRKFYGWIQNDRRATQIKVCELTVPRRGSKTKARSLLSVGDVAKSYLAPDSGSKNETRI